MRFSVGERYLFLLDTLARSQEKSGENHLEISIWISGRSCFRVAYFNFKILDKVNSENQICQIPFTEYENEYYENEYYHCNYNNQCISQNTSDFMDCKLGM